MITNHKYEPDIRIRREAEGLVKAGHNVHIACRGQYVDDASGEINGVKITRICANSKIIHNIAERIYAATWYQPIWLLKLREILNHGSFDLIYYHDIEHARLATKLANWYDLPVLADLHEMYPQAAKLWRQSASLATRLDPKMLFTPTWRLKRLERFAVTHADGLITINNELLNYFVEQYSYDGISKVIRNVPDLERLDRMQIKNLGYEDEFVISYIGGFTPQRGIERAIKAMPDILRSIPKTRLLLVGDSSDNYMSSLQTLCEEIGVFDHVEFTGWVDFESIRSYYEVSDVTIIPYHSTQASIYALPNKLIQSMAFRTPVVVSNLPTMDRIVTETGSGLTFGEDRSLADAVIELYNNKSRRQDMGDRGREAVEAKYNIKEELASLQNIVESLSKNHV
jgi:glycosyltransferase involved in cell wall biosynthesis